MNLRKACLLRPRLLVPWLVALLLPGAALAQARPCTSDLQCNDFAPCTVDSCDLGTGTCSNPLLDGYCLIAAGGIGLGACIAAGTPNVGNPCLVCDPSVAPRAWSPAAAGTACTADADPCTSDVCDPAGNCQHLALEVVCDDGFDADCDGLVDCEDDDCRTRRCSDGDPCTEGERCSTSGCAGGVPATCATAPSDCLEPTGTCDPVRGCLYQPKADGTACTPDLSGCTDDLCSAGECTHPRSAAGTVCRAAAGTCDQAETCTGMNDQCPFDLYLPMGLECRPAADLCDAAEVCTGFGAGCPSDTLAAAGTICRAAASSCDPAEVCGGASPACPTDARAPDGTPCGTGQTCAGGVCGCQTTERACGDGLDDDCDGAVDCLDADCGGLACDDGNACTEGERCGEGGCGGGRTVVCDSPPGDCHEAAGTCDPTQGCVYTPKPDGTACTEDGLGCSADVCTRGTCLHPALPVGTVCRPAAGSCDLEEVCNGWNLQCPRDLLRPQGFACRAAAGSCDAAEACDGTSATCPVDGLVATGTFCRVAADVCDAAEACDGASALCPQDGVLTAGSLCRGAAGECDLSESCDGVGTRCPADAFAASTTSCSDDGNACTADACAGSSPTCTHAPVADGTACGAGVTCVGGACGCAAAEGSCADGIDGDCDQRVDCADNDCTNQACDDANLCTSGERCSKNGACAGGKALTCTTPPGECFQATGSCDPARGCVYTPRPSGAACTDDGNPCTNDLCNGAGVCNHEVALAGTVCRAAADACDAPERCDAAGQCPLDAREPAGSVCRAAAGPCDVAEVCGASGLCPADAAAAAGTPCRPAVDECDAAEVCDGVAAACPVNANLPAGAPCTDDGNPCTDDVCGRFGTCTHGAMPAGTVCRPSAGACDPAEACLGTVCPQDGLTAAGTPCRAAAGSCDVAEVCSGAGADCPADAVAASGVVCRPTAGACDLAETCDGASASCAADTHAPASLVCRASAGACDVAESCSGSDPACPSDAFALAGDICRPASGACDRAEQCSGTGATCPADAAAAAGTACLDDGNTCTTDACDASGSCVHSAAANGTACGGNGTCQAGICLACGNGATESLCGDGADNDCDGDADCADADCSGVGCNDGDACSLGETCQNGACSGGLGLRCPPATGCWQEASCDPASGLCRPNPAAEGTPCDDDANACTDDVCDGAGGCSHRATSAGTVCRAAAGGCDVAERCDGAGATCPTDRLATAGAVCRAAVSLCDLEEACDGLTNTCPADLFASAGRSCRAAAAACDVEEACSGTSGECPADAFALDGLACADPVVGACLQGRCNHAPVAAEDGYEVQPGTPLEVFAVDGVLDNDTDPDGQALVAVVAQPPQHGTLTLQPSGAFRFDPEPGYLGPDEFTYRASDGAAESAETRVALAIGLLLDGGTPGDDGGSGIVDGGSGGEDAGSGADGGVEDAGEDGGESDPDAATPTDDGGSGSIDGSSEAGDGGAGSDGATSGADAEWIEEDPGDLFGDRDGGADGGLDEAGDGAVAVPGLSGGSETGCGCSTTAAPASALPLLIAMLSLRRRRAGRRG